jgi:hypothetical protein
MRMLMNITIPHHTFNAAVKDGSVGAKLAEPWFLIFQADVEFRIAMTPDDFKRSGIDGMAKQWC